MVEAIIYGVAIFVVGSVLMLERRCLGQMAFVQPLVVCLLAGWLVDNREMGLWLGISLQLLSVSPMRRFDWALSGVVAAFALMMASKLGIELVVGNPSALALVVVVLWVGALARLREKRYARIDGEMIRRASPLKEDDAVTAIESHVYRVIARYFFVGGLQTAIGTALVLLAVFGVNALGQVPPVMKTIFAVMVPVAGAAVAMSSLVEIRYFIWTGVSAAIAVAVMVFI